MLLYPKDVEVQGKKFIISKFPSVAGREIVSTYQTTGFPKITDYQSNQAAMFKLMAYVAVPMSGTAPLKLTTEVLIDNHTSGWEMLVALEDEMMKYNCSFLQKGQD